MATISFERNVIIKNVEKIEEIQKELEKPTSVLPYQEKELTKEQQDKIKKWFCH